MVIMLFSKAHFSIQDTHFLFIVSLTVFCQNADANYLTTISRGFTSTESGNPYFECYPEPNNPNAEVTTGRYADTRNTGSFPSPENQPPPSPEIIISEDPPSIIYRTELNTIPPIGYGSYGVFYCSSSVDGTRTVVPTIFLRSDAYFVPSGGRFTQTVIAEEVNVSIQFDRIYQSPVEDNIWRFDSTSDYRNYFLMTPDIAYTITDPIQTSQDGIYEIHVHTLRYQARGGLMRLIIKECPMGRYNSSSGCLQTCSCYNGGICDDETGRCICAPGFKGETCQEGCGGNRFGRSCEYRCNTTTDDETACSGVQMCLPDPYGCSCAPGYKGLNCTMACDEGEFGASCTETCHCVSGECDRFTGVCTGSSTECQPGWTGSSCQECVAGRYGQKCTGTFQVENTAKNEGQPDINFSCRRDGGKLLSSAPPVVVLYRKTEGSEQFSHTGITNLGNIPHESSTIEFFNVDYVTPEDLFVCVIYDVNSYISAEVHADLNILPRLSGSPIVQVTTTTSITLSWDRWMAGVDVGDPPLIGYHVYYKEAVSDPSSWTRLERGNVLDVTEVIGSLSPDTDYVFGVSAIREGEGGEGPLKNITASTACLPPTKVLSHVTVHQVPPPQQILITWQSITSDSAGANCRRGFTNISVYYSSTTDAASRGSLQLPVNTTGSYYLTSLEPGTEYSIYMTLWNKDEEGPRSQPSIRMTSQRSVSCSIVPWALVGITLLVCVVIIVVLIWQCKRIRANAQSSTSRAEPKTIDDQPAYENPVFESPPANAYESIRH